MRNPFKRAMSVPAAVISSAGLGKGERVLAGTVAKGGTWLLGTREALLVVPPGPSGSEPTGEVLRIPWQHVERADWDSDAEQLTVLEIGEFGRVRPRHTFEIEDPGLLLELLRERVTASVVLQRRVPVHGKTGVTVVARRTPGGDGEITWAYEFDRGVDPEDPEVMAAAERALQSARNELGV